MRIVVCSDTYPPQINGVAVSARNLCRALTEHGHEVLIVTPNPTQKSFEHEGNIIRLPGIKMKRYYGYILTSFWSRHAMKIIREFKPDLIHIQTDGPVGQFGFLTASKLKVPTVYTYHTMIEDYAWYVTGGVLLDRAARSVVRSYVRSKSRSVDEFITPSPKIKDYMRYIGVDAYLNIIPTGIDFAQFAEKNIDQGKLSALRESLHLAKNEFVLLSLGRLAKEKSVDVTLRGFHNFVKDNPAAKVKFLIVGGGPDLESFQETAKKLGIADKVVFVGPVPLDEIQYYYALSDCFVSASTSETQGLTFMEAMASRIPLLVRYDESLTDLIENERNGFFYFDEHEMATQLFRVMNLGPIKRASIVNQGLKTLEPYSLEKFYSAILEVYTRAIKKKY